MIATEQQTRTKTAGEHIRLLGLLGRELERAMDAISRNDLAELEDSIANQESLGSALNQTGHFLRLPVQTGEAVDFIDGALGRQIRAAVSELKNLNLRYSLLLGYSSRSMAQMASLLSFVRGQMKEDTGAGTFQTWSCRL